MENFTEVTRKGFSNISRTLLTPPDKLYDQQRRNNSKGPKEKTQTKRNCQTNRNLMGSTYGRFCIKFPQSRMKGERHRLSPLSL
jgi:hypothetical protein